MTNGIIILIALIVMASVMIIALNSKTKLCDLSIEFGLLKGFKISFGTKESNRIKRTKKPKKSNKTDETNAQSDQR